MKHTPMGNRKCHENMECVNIRICGTCLNPEHVEIRTSESLSEIRPSMLGCISGHLRIQWAPGAHMIRVERRRKKNTCGPPPDSCQH